MPERREFKSRRRKGAWRGASLIVIAAEGTRTEFQYFSTLAREKTRADISVHVIERESGASSPRHVIRALNQFKKDFKLGTGDELWMVIDRDRWEERNLADVAAKCMQKGYILSVSNPAFELWLLLHIKDINEYSPNELKDLEQNDRVSPNRTRLEYELHRLMGSYNKCNLDMKEFLKGVDNAVERARVLDTSPNDRWPRTLGTRVYLLGERIRSQERPL